MSTEKLGFIGLGNMGHPMAKNLEKAGFSLTVYNRSSDKAEDFKEKSAVADSIADLVYQSDIVFTMLSNDQSVEEVYKTIEEETIEGKLFVDMSTISPALSQSISEKLKAKGAFLLDAPVAGSTKPAAEATLIIMVGGDEDSLRRATPYLEKLGKSIKYLGENGKGLMGKLAVNYYLAMVYEGLAETYLFAQKLGIDGSLALDIINESAAGSGATKVKTAPLLEANYAPAFTLDFMLKDIKLAKAVGAAYPVGNSILNVYQEASDAGFGKEDVIGVINYLKELK
ncbi:NAD(P)-dependent oxidoreductase [Sphingobacterium hungaricum]